MKAFLAKVLSGSAVLSIGCLIAFTAMAIALFFSGQGEQAAGFFYAAIGSLLVLIVSASVADLTMDLP